MRHSVPGPVLSGCRFLASAVIVVTLHSGAALADDPRQWIDSHLDAVVSLYQHFHRNPELSLHEERTGQRVAAELKAAGYDVTSRVGGHGVVGLLKNGDGPCVMWRCDLDALPVTERTGLEYASTVRVRDDKGADVGVMHACGHDIHITNLIAAARYMAAHRDQWKGTLMFVAQPAEEHGDGAQNMLEDGLFERFPKPQFAVALHTDATLPAGVVGYRAGYTHANVDSCDITVKGRGGHGSFPQGCIDPIVQAAELVVALQTIVSREISPLDPAVVTVGSIHGGTKHNIIPDTCHLQLTIRSYAPDVRTKIQTSIRRKAQAIATAYGAPEPVVEFDNGTPAVFNDEDLVSRVAPAIGEAIGAEKLAAVERTMGGEDFSRYGLAGVPIFMFRLGAVSPERMEQYARAGTSPPSLHSAEFYPEPKETLRTGLLATVAALNSLLGRPR